MNYFSRIAVLALLFMSISYAQAHDHSKMMQGGAAAMGEDASMEPVKAGDLTLSGAFTRATLPGAKVGGGYVKIENQSKEPDRLIGGSSPAAARVEVHEMKMDGNVMQMRKLKEGLEIPAGGTAELSPGGTHLMLIDLTAALKEGDMVPVTLDFAKAGKVEVQFMVGPAGATSMEHN
ncbi:copper chaperone PCu(A)C [Phyllobacterium sp. LjRoot231]|uniref:copper chaperone PCu(A)C n=1 Tax=Phyllobacterium sp. LjRoot231 TaxID=3342289 RepID=UPI003ECF0F88